MAQLTQSVLEFDGKDDYLSATDNPSLQIQAYTVEIWMKPDGVPNQEWKGIIGKPGRNFNIWLNNQGFIHHRFHNPASTNAGAPNTPNGSIVWDQWQHIAITNDGTTAKTYINGKLMAEGATGGALVVDKTPLCIGHNLDGSKSHFFQGQLADARIWNQARSQAEIQANMNVRLTGNEVGLVGYWPLNDSNGAIAKDQTKNANNLTISGNATWMQAEVPIEVKQPLQPATRPVISFDGQNACVDLGKKPTFKIEKNITVEAWIYAIAESKWAGIVLNIFDTGATESGYGLLLDGNTGVYFGLKIPSQGIEYLSSGAKSLKLNEWHHVAGTYDGQQLKVYVNGIEKASKALPAANIHYDPEKELLIGMYRDDDETYPFKGQIAEVRLWNCVRSANELQRDMGKPLPGNEPGLVGYWPLNEGTGTTVQDQTNNANNGTLSGNAAWVQAEVPIEVKQPSAPPNLQSVLSLDGQDDYVELPGKSIPSGNEITVSFWSYGGNLLPKPSSIIAAKGPNNERILNIHLPSSDSIIYFDSGNQEANYDRINKAAQASEFKDKWSHWAFTKNVTTGEMKIYLNGELWHSETGKTMPLIPATRVTLGCFSNSQLYHHGMISELQIWNKARSQDEIKADMNRRLVGDEPGLVSYWPLNEGTGSTVQDQTKNANNGTISGNATWVKAELPIEIKQPQPEAPVVTQEQPQPETPVVTQEQPQPEAPVMPQEQPLVITQEHSESAIVKQTQEQPKKRKYPYKILSIDGGGIRGIIPGMILAEIERRTERPISSMFDLLAGTSTGGILALGLAKPNLNPNAPAARDEAPQPAYTAQDLVSMFAKYASEIFYEPIIEEILGNIDDIIKPKYTSDGRDDVLKRFFGFTSLQETLKEVFITSYDIELRTPVFFTSNPKKQNLQSQSFRRICRGFTMKQAAMATSAAPTYFSPYRIQTSQSPSSFYNLVDGGVFANNPTSLALIEAMNNAKAAAERGEESWTINDVLVVSLGTGSLTKVYPYNEAKNWGLLGWVRPLINIILDATSESVSCELEQLLQTADKSQKGYYRFQAYLDERLEPMDNSKAENIRMLTRVAKQIIEEREEDIESLCNELTR